MQNLFYIIPTPVTIPPAGTSSLPYNSWPANYESSKKGLPGSNILLILYLTGNLFYLFKFY